MTRKVEVRVTDLRIEVADGRQTRTIVENVNFVARSGSVLGLVGPSGSGKTSVLSCVAGVQKFSSGKVICNGIERDGTDLADKEYLANIGFVFQDYHLFRDLSVADNIALPCRIDGVSWIEARSNTRALLDRFEISELASMMPAKLSGGERQRVAIARAMARNPPVIVADEPTAHLDDELSDLVVSNLKTMASSGASVIVSTHDQRVRNLCDKQVLLGVRVHQDSE